MGRDKGFMSFLPGKIVSSQSLENSDISYEGDLYDAKNMPVADFRSLSSQLQINETSYETESRRTEAKTSRAGETQGPLSAALYHDAYDVKGGPADNFPSLGALSAALRAEESADAGEYGPSFKFIHNLMGANNPQGYDGTVLLATSYFFWPNSQMNQDGSINVAHFKNMLAGVAAGTTLVLDIEHWHLRTSQTYQQNQASIDKYIAVAEIVNEMRPDLEFGFYGLMPVRDYWTPVLNNPANVAAWKALNDQVGQIAEHVDLIFPSIYTFYDNMAGWKVYAEANLLEAVQHGKPVIPYMWAQYHDSNQALRGHRLPLEDWFEQLKFVAEFNEKHGTDLIKGLVDWGFFDADYNAINADVMNLVRDTVLHEGSSGLYNLIGDVDSNGHVDYADLVLYAATFDPDNPVAFVAPVQNQVIVNVVDQGDANQAAINDFLAATDNSISTGRYAGGANAGGPSYSVDPELLELMRPQNY
jgi:hypothetical protein